MKKTAPVWMNDQAKKEWRRVIKLIIEEEKELEEKDFKTLETYCVNYAKWLKCEEILDHQGLTFETPNGYVQQRPEVSIGNKAQERLLAAAKELGLTPAARARMNRNKIYEKEEEFDTELEDMISDGT
ncbi:phage terminase small subunit P27 family [Acetobacterium wieringae]|uniref:Phage terminase, small subunit n=1 Tax=Acetobacterium wieringae TaxID=52694 RepID=A0A1F2PDF0_9FIRM|nr:phage terminase small subunit P27 family [Acetobacterium wieringae]OFV69407.1 phage terminase, small subunit [Acetobacterium wieringae]